MSVEGAGDWAERVLSSRPSHACLPLKLDHTSIATRWAIVASGGTNGLPDVPGLTALWRRDMLH